jgi:tetratricopeptide (TPR) repeat protein
MATIIEALQLARQHYQANHLAEAEQIYLKILAKQPDLPEALYGLAVVMQQVGQLKEAEDLLNTILQVQPDSVKTWFSLGNLYQTQGEFSKAEAAYQQAIAYKPDSAPLYNNLGYTLQLQDKFDEAANCYQKALELQPNCVEADANLGNMLHLQNRLSTEQQTSYAQLNYKLGIARQQTRNWKDAIVYYRQAIALQPDLLEAYYSLGLTLQEQGELEEAIASYEKVLELNPHHTEVYFHLGKIYNNQNKLPEAISAYQQGLKLTNPHYSKVFVADQASETVPEVPVTPPLFQGEVVVGNYKFPQILPVSADEKQRPFWTVVIPAYKRTKHLLECLASVLRQWPGEEEMEILVMDNASTPPLFDLVNAIGKGIVHYYRNSENLGVIGNHNAGLTLSRGEWIHILHDDDYILPGFYSQLKQSLDGCSDSIGAAFTGFENIDEQGIVISQGDIVHWYGEKGGIIPNWLLGIGVTNPLRPPAIVIRRATHEHLGGYCPELSDLDGWELCKRIATFYDCWYEPGILAHYRLDTTLHTNKMSNDLFLTGNHAVFLRRAIEISESYFPPNICAEITAKARSYNFKYLIERRVVLPLKAGKINGALRMIQEALKIDQSPQAVEHLFAWLTTDDATPLRDEIASTILLSNNWDNMPAIIPSESKHLQTAIAP